MLLVVFATLFISFNHVYCHFSRLSMLSSQKSDGQELLQAIKLMLTCFDFSHLVGSLVREDLQVK